MDPGLIIALLVAVGSTVAAGVAIVRVVRDRDEEPAAAAPSEAEAPPRPREPSAAEAPAPPAAPRRPGARILLLVVGTGPADATMEAALRMAREEGGTLVPTYLARIPETQPLDAPPPLAARTILERIERRAAEAQVPIEMRIQRGRSYRHAVGRLLEDERFDPIIATASGRDGQGLSPYDVAWLLERTGADVVVFRPG
jgi:pyruvate/2-oxoglutarate dehydrogenase complex dihydrolipoamide acyltransferase (E2) component